MKRFLSVLLLLTLGQAAWADQPLFNGAFGTWLKQSAAPELVETLALHPKFKGEKIQFATVINGKTQATDNTFISAVEAHLTHQILKRGKNDIAWQHNSQCSQQIHPATYAVTIQVSKLTESAYQVDFKILDVADSVWVSGVSLSWTGRLLAQERQALATQIDGSRAGSATKPLKSNQHRKIATSLGEQYKCTWPAHLEGLVFFERPQSLPLQLTMAEIEADMHRQPGIVIANEIEQAQWIVKLSEQRTPVGATAVAMTLTPHDQLNGAQTLARIYVHSNRPAAAKTDAPLRQLKTLDPPATLKPAPQKLKTAELLSTLSVKTNPSTCTTQGDCIGIEFELSDDAYVMVFRTLNATISYGACRKTLKRKPAGVQIYKIGGVAKSPDRFGVYVLASTDRAVMQRLHNSLKTAPGACGRANHASHQAWMNKTTALINSHASRLSWRATHLVNTPRGMQEI